MSTAPFIFAALAALLAGGCRLVMPRAVLTQTREALRDMAGLLLILAGLAVAGGVLWGLA